MTNLSEGALKAFGVCDGAHSPEKAKKTGALCEVCQKVVGRTIRRKEKTILRRAFSESKLLEMLEMTFDSEYSYHCISGGDIDSLSYLKHVVRQQPLDYCLLSTWYMAMDDVEQLREWVESERISRLDCYCGEIFPGSYKDEYAALRTVVELCGGRICIFRNHSKIFAGTGPEFSFAIESSANINTNPRTENTAIHCGEDIFSFYKEFFDGIQSYNRDFDDWKAWQKSPQRI